MGVYNPNLHAAEQDNREPIDYESLGKWLKRVREKNGLTQEQAATQYFNVSRTVYTKYEKGTVKPHWEDVIAFADSFGEDVGEIRKKVSVAIPDTCALHKNRRLLNMLLNDYDQVVIPYTVKEELSRQKNNRNAEGGIKRSAWQLLATIDSYATEYPDRFVSKDNRSFKVSETVTDRGTINDLKMIELAKELAKKTIGDVVIITDDVDVTSFYDKTLLVDEYVAKRSIGVDYDLLRDLDQEFDNLEIYSEHLRKQAPGTLDAYLSDGMTLLISCIRCNTKQELEKRGGKPISPSKRLDKMRFLLEHGASPDRNDSGRYCLPPITHCVQIGDMAAFDLLLEYGCDYNKASQDETTATALKAGKLNEGNTALMVACWHRRSDFIERLCDLPGICLNQQDSNGFTALIKCAYQRCKMKVDGKPCYRYEEAYSLLLEKGADPLIRDRNNRTAKDWWDLADNLTENCDDD